MAEDGANGSGVLHGGDEAQPAATAERLEAVASERDHAAAAAWPGRQARARFTDPAGDARLRVHRERIWRHQSTTKPPSAR